MKRKYEPMIKLKLKRIEKGLTQAELADKAGLGYNTIGQYENGIHTPRIAHLKSLAEVLECDFKDLI